VLVDLGSLYLFKYNTTTTR